MNKYDSLHRHNSKDITGDKYADTCTTVLHRKEQVTIIQGFPACPECGGTLGRVWEIDYWHCTECFTMWSTLDLVQAIEAENALMYVSIRNLED